MSLIPSFFGNRRGNSIFSDPFALDVWDPFRDIPFPELSRENSAFATTRVDWKETPEAHVFKADLPGLKKEEVKVEVEDDRVLQISGKRNVEKLPENAKMDRVKTAMENGVLTVTVPKEEVKKPDVKAIEISDVVGGRWRIRYEKLTGIDHEKAAARPRRRWAMKMNGRFRGIRLPRCRKLNWRAFAILMSPKRIAEMYGEIINRMKMMDDICPGIVFSGHWGLPVLSHSIIRM
ncbi:hypothetical protein C3L33_21367, partial [Rhododendron williamsianum]